MTKVEYLKARRSNLLAKLQAGSIAILFSGAEIKSTNDQHHIFEPNRNFYYLTGIDVPNYALLLVKNGNSEVFTYLFGKIPTELEAKWNSSFLLPKAASSISGIEEKDISSIEELDSFLGVAIKALRAYKFQGIENVYFDFEREKLNKATYPHKFIKQYPFLKVHDVHNIMCELRQVKDEYEIEEIKESVRINKLALDNVRAKLKDGSLKKENEIEAEFVYTLNKNKSNTSFKTIVASGKNATTLHYALNNDELKKEDLVLIDCGVSHNNYASDISRTYPIGKFSARQKQIYEIVLSCNKEAIKFLKEGVKFSDYLQFGIDYLAKECLKIGLIKEKSEISKYYFHGLGHLLGLDTHDLGDYSQPFKAGMVITVEPGLYIPEENIGIRIEDDVLITKTGSINLSSAIVKEIKEVE